VERYVKDLKQLRIRRDGKLGTIKSLGNPCKKDRNKKTIN
jgi:hypothetical protein